MERSPSIRGAGGRGFFSYTVIHLKKNNYLYLLSPYIRSLQKRSGWKSGPLKNLKKPYKGLRTALLFV